MRAFVWAVVGVLCFAGLSAVEEAKVQVYSRKPGEHGKANTLICHVSGFYPPEILIELVKDGRSIPNSQQTDLAFDDEWHYHLTKSAAFTPNKGESFACKVTHMGKPKTYVWELDM